MFEDGLFQPTHILVIGFLGLAGVVYCFVLVVASLRRKSGSNSRLSSLAEENQRLREEINRLKGGKA